MSYIPDDEIIENDAIEDNAGTRNASEGATVVSVVDEPDEHGGTIRYINAVSLEGDTVSPDVLLRGYTAHNALGQPITGKATGGGSGGTRSRKWVTGEIITAEKLNSMEDYVADAISMIGQSNVIIGSGAPTSSTQAEVGQLYADVTDGYNLYVCIEKTPGEGTTWYHGMSGYNTAVVYLYKRSASEPTIDWTNSLTYNFANKELTSVPFGWSMTIPSGREPLYVTAATAYSNMPVDTIDYTEWSSPVILSRDGSDGTPGESGMSGLNVATVFLYQRSSVAPQGPREDIYYTFSSGAVSGLTNNWVKNIPTSDGNPCYVIQATASSSGAVDVIESSEWSSPVILVEDGVDGSQGPSGYNNAIIYLYQRSDTAPSVSYVGDITYTFADDSINFEPSGWKRNIDEIGSGTAPIWVTAASASSNGDFDTIASNEWSEPIILSRDGANGSAGYNNAIIYLYQRSETAPTVSYLGNITYTFADDSLNAIPSGWYRNLGLVPSSQYPMWVTAASASSTGPTDTIEANEWSAPIILAQDGADGSNGANGTNGLNVATVFLYQRASTTPQGPSASITYTFATGDVTGLTNNWVKNIPTSHGYPCYVIQATAANTGASDTIDPLEWSSPVVLVEDGANGLQGPAGYNKAIIYLYQRNASTPTAISYSDTIRYTFNGDVLNPVPSGWYRSLDDSHIVSGTAPIWVTAASASSNDTYDDIAALEWSAPVKMAQNGADGVNSATIYLYQRADSVPNAPSGDITYRFEDGAITSGSIGLWSRSIPATGTNPCYVTQATAISSGPTDTIDDSEWSEVALLAQNGINGTPGYNNAIIYLYKRGSVAPPKPDVNSTYYFSSDTLDPSSPSGWVRSLSDNSITSGTDPIWLTAASASSRTDQDTIEGREWSDPVMMSKLGEDGSPGSPGRNTAIIYLYRRSSTNPGQITYSGNLTYTFSDNTLSPVPTNWYRSLADEHITSGTGPIWISAATASSTTSDDTIASSEWSAPVMISGADGAPGSPGRNTAIIYLYRRSSTNPGQITYNGNLTYRFSDNTLSSVPTNWYRSLADNGIVSSTEPIWISAATASSTTDEDTIASSEWALPVLMAQNGTNGDPGSPGNPGLNSATVFLYQRKASAPTNKCGTQVTYTFSTGKVTNGTSSGVPVWNVSNGWYPSIAEATNASGINASWPCYVIHATAASATDTDTISTSEWSDISLFVENGLNSATVYLYQRKATAPTSKCGTQVTYTFSTGKATNGTSSGVPVWNVSNGWYPSIAEATSAPNIDSSWPCYVIQATATSVTDTDTIPTSEWSGITLMVENGINVATVYLYQRGASAPSKPGASSTYTFSTGQLSGYSSTVTVGDLESGYWSGSTKTASTTRARTKDLRYITKGSKITYTITTYDIQVYILATQSSTSALTSSWRTSSGTYTVTQNGYLAFNIRNHSDTSATVDPTAWDGTISIAHIGGYGAWAQTPPAADGNPCYITQATASNSAATDSIASSEWSAPSVFVEAGNNGYNTAIAYLYKRSGGTTAPTINWTNDLTYSFVSKSITSTAPSGWSKTIPSTGTDPLYVTTATAYSNTNNDTIPYTEWSTPVMLAKDGLNTATVFLYQRKSPAPNKPSTSSTYTFSTKDITGFNNGWSTTIQAANSASGVDMSWPLYVTQATAASTSDQDTIDGSEWSSPTILVENGAKGDTGPQGPAGKGISSITEYYALNNSTTAPADSSFSTTVKTPTASNKYVWNYELITYTDSTTSTTTKHIVATYGDTGTAGKGISSITEYYAINNSTTAPADSAFGTSIVQPTSSNRYLWNYEKITYTDSTTTSTGKRVIGVYGQQGTQGPTGATGDNGLNVAVVYMYKRAASVPTSTAAKPSSEITYTFSSGAMSPTSSNGWSKIIPSSDGNPCYVIQATAASAEANYSIPTTAWSSPPTKLVEDGDDGRGVSKVTPQYAIGTSASTAPTSGWSDTCPAWESGKYIWTRTKTEYTDGSGPTYSTAVVDNAIGTLGQNYTSIKQTVDNISLSAETLASEVGTLSSETYASGVYRFTKTSDGYYTSQNAGVNNSVAYGKLTFNFSQATDVIFDCISYGESSFDYGILSKLDTSLSQNTAVDAASMYIHNFSGESSPDPQSFSMNIPSGSHYVTFKYRKDGSTHSGTDNFKIKAHTAPSGSRITLTSTGISAQSADISFSGLVKFTDLSGNGTTQINGANIITDTVKLTSIYLNNNNTVEDYKVFQTALKNVSGIGNVLSVQLGGLNTRANTDQACVDIYGDVINFNRALTTGNNYPLAIDPNQYEIHEDGSARHWFVGNSDYPMSRIYSDRYYFNDTGAYLTTNSSGTALYFYDKNDNPTILN